jgi:hypothetical protein
VVWDSHCRVFNVENLTRTSEIQRAIIGGQIKKRGLGPYVEWV